MSRLMTKPTKWHVCQPSEDSDQPGHPPSLIRVFTVRLKKVWVLGYPVSAQRRLWSDWADAQADLSLCWVHRWFCWFCHEVAHINPVMVCLQKSSLLKRPMVYSYHLQPNGNQSQSREPVAVINGKILNAQVNCFCGSTEQYSIFNHVTLIMWCWVRSCGLVIPAKDTGQRCLFVWGFLSSYI